MTRGLGVRIGLFVASVDVIQLLTEKINELQTEKKLDSIDRNQTISSLGVDSLLVMEVVGEIQDDLGIVLLEKDLGSVQKVADLEKLIIEAMKT